MEGWKLADGNGVFCFMCCMSWAVQGNTTLDFGIVIYNTSNIYLQLVIYSIANCEELGLRTCGIGGSKWWSRRGHSWTRFEEMWQQGASASAAKCLSSST